MGPRSRRAHRRDLPPPGISRPIRGWVRDRLAMVDQWEAGKSAGSQFCHQTSLVSLVARAAQTVAVSLLCTGRPQSFYETEHGHNLVIVTLGPEKIIKTASQNGHWFANIQWSQNIPDVNEPRRLLAWLYDWRSPLWTWTTLKTFFLRSPATISSRQICQPKISTQKKSSKFSLILIIH